MWFDIKLLCILSKLVLILIRCFGIEFGPYFKYYWSVFSVPNLLTVGQVLVFSIKQSFDLYACRLFPSSHLLMRWIISILTRFFSMVVFLHSIFFNYLHLRGSYTDERHALLPNFILIILIRGEGQHSIPVMLYLEKYSPVISYIMTLLFKNFVIASSLEQCQL